MRRTAWLLVAAAALAAGPGSAPVAAQEKPPAGGPLGGNADAPAKPLAPEEKAAADRLFAEGMDLLKKDQYDLGRAKFQEILRKYPGADEDLLRECEDRGGKNCLVGIEEQHHGGPPERRIDIELMGDGYTGDKFKGFAKIARDQMVDFWADPLYDEYENYFNVWRFDLISEQDGVDEMSAADKGIPPPEPDPRKRQKPSKPKKLKELQQYSTALNCKAAGPANQVWADPEQVMRWRRYLKCSDGLTLAFAKKGQLGMGGGGIATTGVKVAVVHEFGHAFVGLLDEYVNNPSRPPGRICAANAISTDDPDPRKPPPMDEIPWKHWLLLKDLKGMDIDVLPGGATYALGVFRPAKSCAMNAGGGGHYCWVCREEGVRRIYSYLSPVDESGPAQDRVQVGAGETKEFFVVPMAPKKHRIQVEWYLQRTATAAPTPKDPAAAAADTSFVQDPGSDNGWQGDGPRLAARQSAPLPEGIPPGRLIKSTVQPLGKTGIRSSVTLQKLDPGGWRLVARVFDDTKVPGYSHPWVIKDLERLREEWRTWDIEVPR